MQTLRSAQNPLAMLNQMAQGNPMYKQALDIVNQYGGDYNRAFRDLAAKNGYDPNEIMRMIM